MKTQADALSMRYRMAHNEMRGIDGLQPAEALDELLKYLLVKTEEEYRDVQLPILDVFSSDVECQGTAKYIREKLAIYLEKYNHYANALFHSKDFRLSDSCLAKVHEILCNEQLTELPLDVRSAALRSFLNPKLRKGLGIFLTPDQIVEEIIDFFDFPTDGIVADPACGSGTFLMSAAKRALSKKIPIQLYGIDKSPRMMLLAELNMGSCSVVPFHKRVCDTLRPTEYSDFLNNNSADIILTNPPFGVTVDSRDYDLSIFSTATSNDCRKLRRTSSELLFLEQCLSILKPDGLLAIVLPRSAINTINGDRARIELGRKASVLAIITLPPETFGATGTMTNTVVLFLRKFGTQLAPNDVVEPLVSRIENVGFDATGRVRSGNQLPGLGRALRTVLQGNESDCRVEKGIACKADQTLPNLPAIVKGNNSSLAIPAHRTLSDFVTLAATGTTPSRSSYTDSGLFLIKVGNLTGGGINWIPRDRNFVDLHTAAKRYIRSGRLLQTGDIVLTSSAHSPKYIARKIDVIDEIPEWVGAQASFVGEVMLLRPNQTIVDPFVLAAYLRLPTVVEQIQYMVRGQTAHLHSTDLLSLPIDEALLSDAVLVERLAAALRQEAQLSLRMNKVAWQQLQISASLVNQARLL